MPFSLPAPPANESGYYSPQYANQHISKQIFLSFVRELEVRFSARSHWCVVAAKAVAPMIKPIEHAHSHHYTLVVKLLNKEPLSRQERIFLKESCVAEGMQRQTCPCALMLTLFHPARRKVLGCGRFTGGAAC